MMYALTAPSRVQHAPTETLLACDGGAPCDGYGTTRLGSFVQSAPGVCWVPNDQVVTIVSRQGSTKEVKVAQNTCDPAA